MIITNTSMPNRLSRGLIGIVLSGYLGTLLFSSPQVQAQAVWDIAISPPTAYVQARLGTKTVHTITIENTGTSEVTLQPKVVDFLPDGQTGIPQLADNTSFPYLNIPSEGLPTVTIPAGQKAQLKLVIEPPIAAPEKEWPLTVLFSQAGTSTTDQSMIAQVTPESSATQVSGTIGSNLVILVSNQANLPYLLNIESIKVPTIVDSFRDVNFQVLLRNQGLAAVAASGSARVVDFLSNTIYQTDLYPDTVLGNSARAAHALILHPSPPPSDQPQQLPTPLPPQPTDFAIANRILLGPYRIIINLNSPKSEIANPSLAVTFFALPISLLASGIIGCIGFVVFLILKKTQ